MPPNKIDLIVQVEVRGRSPHIAVPMVTKLFLEVATTIAPVEIPTETIEALHLLAVQDLHPCPHQHLAALETQVLGALVVAVIEVRVHQGLLDLLLAVAAVDHVEIKPNNPVTKSKT